MLPTHPREGTGVNNSLQRRLSIWLSAAIVVTGILAAVVSFTLTYDDTKEFQDHMLKQIALLEARNRGGSIPAGYPRSDHASKDSETRIVIVHLPDDPRPTWLAEDIKPGFHTLQTDKGRARVFVLRDASGKATVVAQPTHTRDEIAMNSALVALVSLLLLLPLMAWITVRIVRNQLAPVNRLAAHLDVQRADRPGPLSDNDVPEEIMPFVQAINRLLQRVSDLISQQRRFIANAAHELRSPLTALSVQAENLKQSATMETMQKRVQPLQAGIERARKLTEQLLSLAKAQAATPETEPVDVSAMARELIAEFLPMSEARGIDLGLEETAHMTVFTAPETLRVMLRNVLENALKFTPDGGEVTLRLYSKDISDVVEIVDSGPGISVAERERVFDPFYRVPGSAGEGSGLGLSIAMEAALSLGGSLALYDRPDGSGLIVRYQQNSKQ